MGLWGDLIKAVRSPVFKRELKTGDFQVKAAEKLATKRSFVVNLESSAAVPFDGTGNIAPGVNGVLPVGRGGTGASKAGAQALSNIGLKTKRLTITLNEGANYGEVSLGVNPSFCVATITGIKVSASQDFNTVGTNAYGTTQFATVYVARKTAGTYIVVQSDKSARYYQVDVMYI